jgi:hypothetical protein
MKGLTGWPEGGVKNPQIRVIIRNFLLELLIYAALVVAYFFLVLRFLAEPLERLFGSSLYLYAIVCLVLIVVQAVVLEVITTFIIKHIGLEQLG